MSEETTPSAPVEAAPDESCNIKVICRVRPLNQREENEGSKFVLKFPTDDSIAIGGKAFVYDKVLQPASTQSFVYETIAKPIVADVLSGYNGTIFAYGQTCSGKTHTMEGVMDSDDLQGIIPRIISDIFAYIYQMDENLEFHIKVSYYEIYMEKIRDLLDVTKTNLAVHEDRNRVPYVKGATERFVSCPEEVLDAIEEGKSNRHVAVTNMNEHSSRSHSVFLINVKQENTATQKKLSGKLYLVDLAGSEKVSKTGAEGAVLDEAKNINKSLSSLGNVISNLAEGSSHIPYRDSKLTRILQESLGGNARTTMVICCSPASYNDSETKSTLMFGQRAKTIKNTVIVNEELTADEWKRRYEKEKDRTTRLKSALERYEAELGRWRQGDSVPDAEQTIPSSASMLNLSSATATSTESSRNAGTGSTSTTTGQHADGKQAGMTASATLASGDWEIEKCSLYNQLDDKDDEINTQSQLVEKLKEQMQEQEQLMVINVKENENLNSEVNRLQLDCDSSKDEIKDVIQALEELAMNYENKTNEIDNMTKQNDTLNGLMKNNLVKITSLEDEMNEQKSIQIDIRKRIGDMMISLMNDLNEMGSAFQDNINSEMNVPVLASDGLEDEFMNTRVFVSKAKSEIKTLISRGLILEQNNQDCERKLSSATGELSESRLQIQQHMVKISTLQESQKLMESEKDKLEQSIDKLTDECATAKAQEQLMDKEKSQENSLLSSLEQQMQQHREQHHKQLTGLRSELSEKQQTLDTLNEEKQKLKLLLENLQGEHERLKIDEQVKSNKLSEMVLQCDRREQAKSDLNGLEDRVTKEIHTLYNLRKLFVKDLHDRLSKSKAKAGQDDEDEVLSITAQKQKINFLESNLDQLTKVHKQLVKDNSDLRCELPKKKKVPTATLR